MHIAVYLIWKIIVYSMHTSGTFNPGVVTSVATKIGLFPDPNLAYSPVLPWIKV